MTFARSYVVAIKYGYYSREDYAVVCNGSFSDAVALNKRQMLVSGWMRPNLTTLRTEVLDAAARNRIDIHSLHFDVER
jgi:hypothetical protein